MIGNMTNQKKTQAIKDLCEGVYYLHVDMKMVHRDMKPTNILIKGSVMKLADFGRSKCVAPNEKMTAVVGTKYYMPP
jgi:serine/threonine protein kinase